MLTEFFQLQERKTSVRIEVVAGLTTFLTMSYIIFTHPNILSPTGMDKNALIAVTCIVSGLATIITGLFANAPIAMAPGLGLNSIFAYLVVSGQMDWQSALGVVFISGLVFFVLTIAGLRKKIVEAIPASLISAIAVGIGLFITFIGLQDMGIIVKDEFTLVTAGPMTVAILIGLLGLLVMLFLEIRKIKGALLIGIITATIVAVISKQADLPQKVVSLDVDISPIALKLDIVGALKWSFFSSIFTLMFIDMFDSVGTLAACCHQAKMVDEKGNIKGIDKLLSIDAIATMMGALFGTSTTTSYIESASGIEQGGRSGLTSIVTGLLFLVAVLFIPVVRIVPKFATAPALIMVGLFMMKEVKNINFSMLDEAFPAFIIMVMIALSYSISTGLAFGFISFTVIKAVTGRLKEIKPAMWIIAILSLLFLTVDHLGSTDRLPMNYKQGQTPAETGLRIVKNLLNRKDYMLYDTDGLHYAEACTSYSAFRFAGLTGNKELMEQLKKRYGGMIDEDKDKLVSTIQHVDHNVEGILPLEIYIQTGDERFLKLGLDFVDKQWENPRDDGLTTQTRWWIDDMYMVGMLQIQAYRATGDIKYADRAANQLTAYIDRLQQPTGLFYHGPKFHFYWGRGNGWVASSLTEVLKSLPKEHPKRPEIMNSYLRMMSTLLKYQSENGMWRQLIDYEYSWAESSCTAMFTYAMITGVKYGWLESNEYYPAVQKAWNALCAHLDREGNLREICIGTEQQDDIEYYLKRPRAIGDFHGQAPVLWCCCELLDIGSAETASKKLPVYKGEKTMAINLTSTAFEEGGMIPSKYTCDGDDVSPPLKWDSVPDGTVSIALISDDPDAPMGTWVHWVLYNLPPDKTELPENFPDDGTLQDGTRQGVTDFGRTGYGGPCPPSGTHRYFFKIYALDTKLELPAGARKRDLLNAMEGHILGKGQLIGKYKRQ